jgi:predicted DNA-binding transcriptional regulator AlpA
MQLLTTKDLSELLDMSQQAVRNNMDVLPKPVQYDGQTVLWNGSEIKRFLNGWLEPHLSPQHAAQVLGVTTKEMEKMYHKDPHFPRAIRIGACRRWPKSKVEAYVKG